MSEKEISADYIKGYNEALADIRFRTACWADVTMRQHGEPYLSKETSKHINKLCTQLRTELPGSGYNDPQGLLRIRR